MVPGTLGDSSVNFAESLLSSARKTECILSFLSIDLVTECLCLQPEATAFLLQKIFSNHPAGLLGSHVVKSHTVSANCAVCFSTLSFLKLLISANWHCLCL